MKAFLLAAGLGTRLRPLTDTVPKCMIPINGKPLIKWWCDLLLLHGVDQVLINTHYLSEQVRDFINIYNWEKTGLTLREFYESMLLGSAGTIHANRSFIEDDEYFFVCYADNLTNINLTAMRSYHESHTGVLTMALFQTKKPEQCGIIKLDDSNCIIDFIEKPERPTSNLANAGIYITRKEIFNYLQKDTADFGKDVLPKLTGCMYGWESHDYLIDIGTIENYKQAQLEWRYG